MVPATLALSKPLPTRPAKAGSWPEPPPETIETLLDEETSGRRKMILFSGSKAREGFVRVMELRALETSWSGFEKKCFAASC